ncbi:exodeoxyribonuclease VII small subunit [Candidatus Saccharibacteria bacterium]|nr:exodeoxyribonuclease VII small subunit [Candidatus Saccharibacteria bacterium]
MTEKMSLNQKIENLDKKAEWFYSDDFNLEEAVSNYKDAVKLAKEIEKDLDNLKNEIEVLAEDFSKK